MKEALKVILRNPVDTTAKIVRGMWYKLFLKKSRGLVLIGKGVKIRQKRFITVGKNFKAEDYCEIQGLAKEGLQFGDNVTIGRMAMIRPSGYYVGELGEGLTVGNNSAIGACCFIGASGKITIGDNVMLGPNVTLLGENHAFEDVNKTIKEQGVIRESIVIEDDCWIGSGVIILAGIRIGRGSIIAAGAVVTKDVSPYTIVGGVPARVIKSRMKEQVAE